MNDEITLEDLKATSAALEGFLDAFGDEDDMAEQVERVRKVMRKMDSVIAEMQGSKKHLRLVNPEEDSKA